MGLGNGGPASPRADDWEAGDGVLPGMTAVSDAGDGVPPGGWHDARQYIGAGQSGKSGRGASAGCRFSPGVHGTLDMHKRLCEDLCVATNLDIDQSLLKEAVSIGRHRSKKAAVTEALREYVARRKQQRIVELFGTIEYAEGYDHRKQRRRA